MTETATQTAFAAPEPSAPDEAAVSKDVLGLPCTISMKVPFLPKMVVLSPVEIPPMVLVQSVATLR